MRSPNQSSDILDQKTSTLPVYTQILQCIGMGVAQLFGLLASFEFVYLIAPRSAQALFMNLHFISRGVASYIAVAYMNVITNFSMDLNFNVSTRSD